MAIWRKKENREDELAEEIRNHLQQSAQDRIDRGATTDEAQQAAQHEFGNVGLVQAATRDNWRFIHFDELLQDIRYGARVLRKNLRFSLVAIFTLALGIGANTAIFSLVNGILLRSLPYPHPEKLVRITGSYPQGGFGALREQVRAIEPAAYAEGHEFNLTGRGEPVRLSGTLVSAEFFSVLGINAEMGRTFAPGEDTGGQSNLVLLSHSLWEQRFASNPNVIGNWINLEGVQRQIIGVMPGDFRFPSQQTQVWVPLNIDPRNTPSFWAGDFMPVIGRLRGDSSMAQATAEIVLFQSRVVKMFPWPMPANWNAGISVVSLQDGLVSDIRDRLLILLAAVALVLLIACANVANLTLSRAAVRAKEIAIRTSLGAGRRRIVNQLITESIILAFAGGALGILLASLGLSLLKSTLPGDTPRLSDVTMDWRVLLFTALLTIATGVLSGIAPALQSSRSELTETLKSGSKGSTLSSGRRVRTTLVVTELALAVLLASGAGLLIRSLWSLSHQNPGFRTENIWTARITPNESFCSNPDRCLQFYSELLNRLRATPAVTNAALVSTLPLDGKVIKRSIDLENHAASPESVHPLLWMNPVSPGYMNLMGISMLRGREFSEADTSANARVAVVSASTARRFWPGQDALGKHIRLDGQKDWCTIVGVASDVRSYDLRQNVPEWMDGFFYVPYGPDATLENGRVPAEMTLVIRSNRTQSRIEETVRGLTSELNPETPVAGMKSMHIVVSNAAAAPRSVTSLFVAFAGLALALGIVGIYGVISYFVAQRTREIGIRISMGAQRSDILKLVLREGLSLTFAGVAIGLVSAYAFTRFLSSLLYGVTATDAVDFAVVAILFSVVALAACYIPARRAMRVDPMVALRYE